jgi:hypothetical protein
MRYQKRVSVSGSLDEEIKNYIQKKKDENSALKKLLNALEQAKKGAAEKSVKN